MPFFTFSPWIFLFSFLFLSPSDYPSMFWIAFSASVPAMYSLGDGKERTLLLDLAIVFLFSFFSFFPLELCVTTSFFLSPPIATRFP